MPAAAAADAGAPAVVAAAAVAADPANFASLDPDALESAAPSHGEGGAEEDAMLPDAVADYMGGAGPLHREYMGLCEDCSEVRKGDLFAAEEVDEEKLEALGVGETQRRNLVEEGNVYNDEAKGCRR